MLRTTRELLRDARVLYCLYGLLFGTMFPLLAHTIFMWETGISFFETFLLNNGLLLIIDSAPLVLGLSFLFIGIKQHQIDLQNQQIAEEKMNRQAKFLETTVNQLPAVFYAKDLDGRFLIVNEAFRELFKWRDADIIGKTNHELYPLAVAEQFRKNDLQIIAKKEVIISEEIVDDHAGKQRVFLSFKFPYLENDGQVFATGGVSLDITEKKILEKQALHSSKLAAIGELAAGIGHEINNPLAVAMGTIEQLKALLHSELSNNNIAQDYLGKFDQASNRIAKIVLGLKTFARHDSDQKEVFNLDTSLQKTVSWVKNIYGVDNIKVSYQNSCDPAPMVHGSPGRIEQSILNLLSNAKDAIGNSDDGQITVDLSVNNDTKEWIIGIKDNGIGIAKEIQEKIFDSFYTTKEVGKGTGIGLSLTQSIIQEHSGKIEFQSEPGMGTTFRVCLPMASSTCEAADTKAEAGKAKDLLLDGKRALIVDDEPGIREILGFMLSSMNCEISEAGNGLEALEKLANETFDFIFTDLKMPKMDGHRLIEEIELRQLRAQAYIFAITGGVGVTINSQKFGSSTIDGFLSKPFNADDLQNLIQGSMSSRYG